MSPMTKPVILAVDDDREVLGAVERDLRAALPRRLPRGRGAVRRAGARGRAGAEAPRHADRALPGRPADAGHDRHRVPAVELRKLHPDAKRALLTAYADSEAAIAAINDVGLDHYLMKPWDPPEEHLYPVLDDLLADWAARARLPFEGVRIVGSRWSPQSYDTRDFLSRNQIPYQWIDVEQDAAMRELRCRPTAAICRGCRSCCWPTARTLVAPSHAELAREGRPADARRRARSTTWRSSAPARPAWRARCTARPKG